MKISFRKLERTDYPRLCTWLSEPHVDAWWHEPLNLAQLEEKYGPRIDGLEPTHVFIIERDLIPIGFIQWYRWANYPQHAAQLGAEAEAVGIDLAIGDASLIGRGIGSRVISQFIAEVIPTGAGITAVVTDPAEGNERSLRAFNNAGFAPTDVVLLKGENIRRQIVRRPFPGPVSHTAGGSWRAVQPIEAASWFNRIRVPWWIAGGWAIDLFLGAQTRPHDDLDFGILRRDSSVVFSALSGWQLFEAKAGELSRLAENAAPRSEVNSLWCRSSGSGPWELEVLLDQADQDHWIFRRHSGIKRPLSSITLRSAEGIPYLAPEIQLLYKSRSVRPRDQADFERVAPRLNAAARAWLKDALLAVEPNHTWIRPLVS
jgi:RimJ/RimL family protein N-acetyltransferase